MRGTGRRALMCMTLMIVGLAASPLWARLAEVTLQDGRKLSGELVSDDADGVTIMIVGIRTPIRREQVKDLKYIQSVPEEYAARRKAIADDDLKGRYDLASWLVEKDASALAKAELEDLAKRFPDDKLVPSLLRLVNQKLEVAKAPTGSAATRPAVGASKPPIKPGGAGAAKPPVKGGSTAPPKFDRLNDEQINLIKVYEIDPAPGVPIDVPRDVIDIVLDKYRDRDEVPKGVEAHSRLHGAEGWEKLQLLFALKARDLYPKVTVRRDPDIISSFRQQVHRTPLLNYCGTSECHGGPEAGKFFVFLQDDAAERTVYTNYFIVHKWESPAGLMIDHEKPDRSLLLEYGLHPALARIPHPQTPKWKPTFFNKDDRYRRVQNWIESLPRQRTQYPIDYVPPSIPAKPSDAATKPAE